ncbi:hypothetical protein [Psychromonas aquimarina]|uniref:hypothetical protein n=1 Tax=Psychromonas aquimarina TaxID=444919 RepID=UPI00048FD71D|nr:hypothetical protein [Psychromonas aquimarina]
MDFWLQIYALAILYVVLEPVYHLKFTLKIAGGLILSLLIFCCIVSFNANDGKHIIAFMPFTVVFFCFMAQLLYCRRVFSLYGFYPRLIYRTILVKGTFVKHPNIDLPKNDADWILSVYALGGVFFGFVIPLGIEFGLLYWK